MRGFPRALVVILFALVLMVGGVVALIFMEVPAPSQPYEKTLEPVTSTTR